MDLISPILLGVSIVLFVQGLFALYLMLYAWQYPERLERSKSPREFAPPRESFSILLPARHEEGVIGETIRGIWKARYPKRLLELVVVCHADDTATIEAARSAARQLRSRRIRVETFAGHPINKPRALNVAFDRSSHGVVTVFDAEDDVHPDLFNVVNTVMQRDGAGIVQGGVQLMNFRDRWYSIHNCLEYYFWFKSRLHFHAGVGMIPLGGNTVFIRRDLIQRVGGWDDQCLTEDADIGIRLSALGEPIRVVYDPEHVTREETPPDTAALVRQRTRWSQGFLQVLRKGDWTGIHGTGRRLLAAYTLSYPILQVLLTLAWPLALFGGFFLKLPVAITMVAFLPLYVLFFQFVASAVGAVVFAREYGQRADPLLLIKLAVTFLPYQWLLGLSALRAVYRELEDQVGWEKTQHTGAHRRGLGEPVERVSVPVRMWRLVPRLAPVRRARIMESMLRPTEVVAAAAGMAENALRGFGNLSVEAGARVVAVAGRLRASPLMERAARTVVGSVASPRLEVRATRGPLRPVASTTRPAVPAERVSLTPLNIKATLAPSQLVRLDEFVATRGTLPSCQHYVSMAAGLTRCPSCRGPVARPRPIAAEAPPVADSAAPTRSLGRYAHSALIVGAVCVLAALLVGMVAPDGDALASVGDMLGFLIDGSGNSGRP